MSAGGGGERSCPCTDDDSILRILAHARENSGDEILNVCGPKAGGRAAAERSRSMFDALIERDEWEGRGQRRHLGQINHYIFRLAGLALNFAHMAKW